MINLKDKRILVFGLGVHGGGLGVAQWLVKQRTTDDQSSVSAGGNPMKRVESYNRLEPILIS